ncbi:GGDEF domain-containing protein [uncultured Ilyobacter sp.]|uniref:GGDEF domain-containing protein n=1 Tax=uncultured Ilyobacter sp. TaxID=544433 RepID=UPI0029C0A5B7|nr:GGDEF domain-containing protein [uncultured Ilyobacter sp.]
MKIEKLRKQKEFLETLMDNLETKMFVFNEDMEVQELNKSSEKMIALDLNDIYGKKCGDLLQCANAVEENKRCGETSKCHKCHLRNSVYDSIFKNSHTNKKILSREDYVCGIKEEKFFLYSSKKIAYGNQDMSLVLIDDITEIEKSRKKLHQLSITDELTGVYNRRFIFESIRKEISRSERTGGIYSLMLIDIDFFKKVNDLCGHVEGDAVLKTIASEIKNNIRDMDLFGRFGGEEFILLLPETDLKLALLCAERLRKAIENISFSKVDHPVTVSIGVGQYFKGEALDDILDRVDKALYKAKKNGRNRVEVAENAKALQDS